MASKETILPNEPIYSNEISGIRARGAGPFRQGDELWCVQFGGIHRFDQFRRVAELVVVQLVPVRRADGRGRRARA